MAMGGNVQEERPTGKVRSLSCLQKMTPMKDLLILVEKQSSWLRPYYSLGPKSPFYTPEAPGYFPWDFDW